jgi:predicted CxxxxCH...CXXCH cytochrome family protein
MLPGLSVRADSGSGPKGVVMVATARVATRAAPFLALLLAACGSARVAESSAGAGACTGCHGDAARASNQAAPPGDTQGAASSPAVGAHLAHLDAGVTCATCHVVPRTMSATGHVDGDGRAEITFGAAAKRNGYVPTYDEATRTCTNTYCHGGSVKTIVSNDSPPWDGAALGCTGCHAYPPASHAGWGTDCSSCHAGTVAPDDVTILVGGGHLDGTVAGGHPGGFSDPAVHGPAAIAFLSGDPTARDCTSCHGADFAGGTSGTSCNACHAAPTARFPSGVADWRANCTFCHGTPTEPYPTIANPVLAAPPEGVAGATAAIDASVGAHRVHLQGEAISDGVLCADCHTVPSSLGHLDGTAAVATKRPGTSTPVGSFGGATCSATWCHGNFPSGKTGNSPSWTATSGQSACDTCHEAQWAITGGTRTGRHGTHDPGSCTGSGCHSTSWPGCYVCHGPYGVGTDPTTVNHGSHVNGTVDVLPDVDFNASTGQCYPTCHTRSEHRVSNPKTW